MSFSQIPWFLLCGGLTVLGLIGSWFTLRRRGARAAARVAAWSLLPIALYLIGIIQPIWNFAYGLVFSPKVWTGLVLLGIAVLVFAVTGGLRSGRSAKKQADGAREDTAGGPSQLTAGSTAKASRAQPVAAPAKRKGAAAPDEDFDEVAQILKRHGIS